MSQPEAATRHIPLLDLQPQYQSIRSEILDRVTALFGSQRFILGPEVEALEQEIAHYSGSAHAIGCASGTDALILALRALDIGPGDSVVTTPYSFFATASSIALVGARPVFVDVDRTTFNIDPIPLASLLDRTPGIKAVIAVHLYGGCADMDPILASAARNGVPVIEDAAQAIGAEYKGRRAGSMGLSGCFSFFPSKNLGGFGDGGMITTGEAEVARKLRTLRVHGSAQKYVHEYLGYNSRLDALQAAVLRVKLAHLDEWTARRQDHAALYRRLLSERGAPVTAPHPASWQTRHVFNQFVIRCDDRDGLREHLRIRGIGTEVYYPVPLHLQPCFSGLGYRSGDLPVSESLAKESLALPVYPDLRPGDIEYVVDEIASFYGR